MKQQRGRGWRRDKTMSKYVSRLKLHKNFALIKQSEEIATNEDRSFKIPKWRTPKSYVDFKNNCSWASSLKNTPCRFKDPWMAVDKKHTIHQQRQKKFQEIEDGYYEYEHRYDEDDFDKMNWWWLDE